MDKSGKVTMELICKIIAAFAASLGIMFMIWLEFRRPMIAIVDGGPWKAPKSVVKDLKAMDAKKIIKMDPNRMTAEDACKTCGWYVVNIRNRGKHKTENTKISIPEALYWEASWISGEGEGEKTKTLSETILLPLPEIDSGRHVDVKVWVACDANRSHAKKMQITQSNGYPARLDIKTPIWPSALYLSQRMSKVVKIYAIIFFSLLLTLIYILIRRRYFP